MDALLNTIVAVIYKHYDAEVEVHADTRLCDIQIDSLDSVELRMDIEEATDIHVTDEDYDQSRSIHDLYVRLRAKREAA